MTIITKTLDIEKLHCIYDDQNVTSIERYTTYFQHWTSVVITQAGESPVATWRRVLDAIHSTRQLIRSGLLCGNQFSYATVYAGIAPTEMQLKEHCRRNVIDLLIAVANEDKQKHGNARVAALILASELSGIASAPQVKMSWLDQVRAEQARRKTKS